MLTDRIEGKWIDTFADVFELCKIQPGDPVAIFSETTTSGNMNVQLSELALLRIKARPYHVIVPSPPHEGPLPFRSSGTTDVIQGLKPVIGALSSAVMVVDCSQESILYIPELPEILGTGARVFLIAEEHPEILERVKPDPSHKAKVKVGMKMLDDAKVMRVTSEAGTDLTIDVTGTEAEGVWGYADAPGRMDHWPGGMCWCFPKADTVNGTLVLAAGDFNCTFKRYMEQPVTLKIENDYVVAVEGENTDADLFRSYIGGTGDRDAFATSHVGWGMNPQARWDAFTIYDRGDTLTTEQRAFAGNFLFSTGANYVSQRYTRGHFDIPLRGCTISLDNKVIVDRGELQGELSYE